ncbi:hypothetical protein BD779DRAFT_1539236 [Infundibulicybe gibba]|nr:hypothetical protein BD779DRAFT_1539236 [Infundibulicybe gibba]
MCIHFMPTLRGPIALDSAECLYGRLPGVMCCSWMDHNFLHGWCRPRSIFIRPLALYRTAICKCLPALHPRPNSHPSSAQLHPQIARAHGTQQASYSNNARRTTNDHDSQQLANTTEINNQTKTQTHAVCPHATPQPPYPPHRRDARTKLAHPQAHS